MSSSRPFIRFWTATVAWAVFRTGSARRIHDQLQLHPFATANDLVAWTGLSAPTVNAALADLERLGVVNEITGRRRGRVFSYRAYLDILGEGTAPIRG